MNEPSGSENLLVISRKSSSLSVAGSAGSPPKERLIDATLGRISSGAGGGAYAAGGAGVFVKGQKKTSTPKRRITPANTLARFFMTRIAILRYTARRYNSRNKPRDCVVGLWQNS